MSGPAEDIEDAISEFAEEWKKQAEERRNNSGLSDDEAAGREKRDAGDEGYQEELVKTGETSQIAVGDKPSIKSIELKYNGYVSGNGTRIIEDDDNHKICQVVDVCGDSSDGSVDLGKVKVDPGTGIAHLEVPVNNNFKQVFGHPGISFIITITNADGTFLSKHYAVAAEEPSREKRWTQYGSWTSWARYSIPDINLMPQYGNVWVDNCLTGHSGTAWAIIFTYYDRRGHYRGLWYLQCLYRSGRNGAWGSCSQVCTAGFC